MVILFICFLACVATIKAQEKDYLKHDIKNFQSAVILQYHNVSTETADITSLSPKQFKQHLDWLEENHFKILPLTDVVNTLKNKRGFDHNYIVALTFDDAHISVCTEAWPILKKRKIPFTLFVNTEAIEKNFVSQCSWKQLKEMQHSGLMTVGNHAHSHLHMSRSINNKNISNWRAQMIQEIQLSEQLIQKHLNIKTDLFAYPYGEYNEELSTLVTNLGYTGFGQHSGAVGISSDFSALPRFPASGRFANLETLSVKLNSLAFPEAVIPLDSNPIAVNGKSNPPRLKIVTSNKMSSVNCFDASSGQPIKIIQAGDELIAQHSSPLKPGRNKYNCTSVSDDPNRFYWMSHQWLVE